MVVIGLLFAGACSKNHQSPNDYQEYNQVVEEYALALIEKDYFTMKRYLPESEIQGDTRLINAKEGESKFPEKREKMGNRYGIYGFDYFFDEHGELYYLVEYYNPNTGNEKDGYVFQVKKNGDKILIQNKTGLFVYPSRFKPIKKVSGYITPKVMKEIMDEHPEHTFVYKEYPER